MPVRVMGLQVTLPKPPAPFVLANEMDRASIYEFFDKGNYLGVAIRRGPEVIHFFNESKGQLVSLFEAEGSDYLYRMLPVGTRVTVDLLSD